MKNILYFILIFLWINNLSSFNFDAGDAKSIGTGSSILTRNANSAWLNPSGISFTTNIELNLSYEMLYLGSDIKVYSGESDSLKNIRFSLSIPVQDYIVGVGFFQFSSLYFNQSIFRFTLSQSFENISIGLNLKYLSYKYIDNEYTAINPYLNSVKLSSGAVGLDLGLIFIFIPDRMNLAFSLLDINRPDVGIVKEDKLPTRFLAGMEYNLDGLNLNFNLEYYMKKFSKLSCGIESEIISKNFPVRIGFDNSFQLTFGFTIKKFREAGIDYAAKLFSKISSTYGSHYVTIWSKF